MVTDDRPLFNVTAVTNIAILTYDGAFQDIGIGPYPGAFANLGIRMYQRPFVFKKVHNLTSSP
jgi:hypothetical protein